MHFEDALKDIFDRQTKLVAHYRAIDLDNNPLDFQKIETQDLIRSSALYILEETSELIQPDGPDFTELPDITHFLAEMTLLGGGRNSLVAKASTLRASVAKYEPRGIEQLTAPFLLSIGDALHTLKNTHWRETFRESIQRNFFSSMSAAWTYHLQMYAESPDGVDSIYAKYVEKNNINLERIRSGY